MERNSKGSKQVVKKPPTYKLSKTLREAIDPANAVYSATTRETTATVSRQRAVRVDGTLPMLPEYLRDFAFRYALEIRSHSDWARIYHVSSASIGQWVRRPDVLKYVMTIRYERRLRLIEMVDQVESKAWRKLNEVLDQKINPANIGTMLNAIFKTLSMTKEGKVPSETPETNNFNILLNQYGDSNHTDNSQLALQNRLEELEAIERAMGNKKKRALIDRTPKQQLEEIQGENDEE